MRIQILVAVPEKLSLRLLAPKLTKNPLRQCPRSVSSYDNLARQFRHLLIYYVLHSLALTLGSEIRTPKHIAVTDATLTVTTQPTDSFRRTTIQAHDSHDEIVFLLVTMTESVLISSDGRVAIAEPEMVTKLAPWLEWSHNNEQPKRSFVLDTTTWTHGRLAPGTTITTFLNHCIQSIHSE